MAFSEAHEFSKQTARLFSLSPRTFKDLGLASVLQSHWEDRRRADGIPDWPGIARGEIPLFACSKFLVPDRQPSVRVSHIAEGFRFLRWGDLSGAPCFHSDQS